MRRSAQVVVVVPLSHSFPVKIVLSTVMTASRLSVPRARAAMITEAIVTPVAAVTMVAAVTIVAAAIEGETAAIEDEIATMIAGKHKNSVS